MAWEVYTFGNGYALTHVFMAVKGLMSDVDYGNLISIVTLISLFFSMLQAMYSGNKFEVPFKTWITVILLVGFLFTPKVDVIVRDEVNNQQWSVKNVPFGLGAFASFFSTVQKYLAKEMDTYFSLPDDLKFSNSGYAFGLTALNEAQSVKIMDPYLYATVATFIEKCTMIEIVSGVKDFDEIVTSNNLLNSLSTNNTAYQTKVYSSTHPSGEWKYCKDAYAYIKTAVENYVNNTLSPFFAKRVTGISALNNATASIILQKLGTAGEYFLKTSLTGQEMLEQAILFDAFKTGADLFSLDYGSAPIYASSVAEKKTVSAWALGAVLAKRLLPLIRTTLEALVYGLFPIILILSLFPGRAKTLQVYITLLLWLTLWTPGEAILNYLASIYAEGELGIVNGNYNIMYLAALGSFLGEKVAMTGSALWLVPTLTYAIIKGSEMAFVSLAGRIGGTAQSAASSSASEVSTEGGLQSLTKQGYESMKRTEREHLSDGDMVNWYKAMADIETNEDAVKVWRSMSSFDSDYLHSSVNRAAESMASGAVGDAGTRGL